MTQRTDLEPHFAGTYHVTDDPGVWANGVYGPKGWEDVPYWAVGGRLVHNDDPLPEDDD